MSYYVYILKCSDETYYVGMTQYPDMRLLEHNSGASTYTSARLPIELVFQQSFTTKETAARAERKIKHWSRIKKEKLISGEWLIKL